MRVPQGGGRFTAASALAALCACYLALAAPARPALPGAVEPPEAISYTGRSLQDALQVLGEQGLKIIFSSGVVTPDMLVTAEPVADDPPAVLEELLAPHGLSWIDGPGATFIVVREGETAPPERVIGGVVRARDSGLPVADAVVRVASGDSEVDFQVGPDGSFGIPFEASSAVTLEVRASGFLPLRLENVTVGPAIPIAVELERLPVIAERLVVSPSRLRLLRQEPVAPLELGRDEITSLPHLGGDLYRALTLLPGATGSDVSVQFHVRGSRRDETQILIDGQELYEAYHLEDYDSALSFVAPGTIGSADLSTGGFPVQYGDRMSGVLDMTTVTPSATPRFRVGLSVLNAQIGGQGRFKGERGGWMAELRQGSGELVDRLLRDGKPKFWDGLAKVDWKLDERQSARLNLLASGDELDFRQTVGGEEKRFATQYSSGYAWLTHHAVARPRLVFSHAASVARIDRERRGFELEDDIAFAIRDVRDSEVLDLKQGWDYSSGGRLSLSWGGRWRQFETVYDYSGSRQFDNPLARIRHDSGMGSTLLAESFRDRHGSLYASARLRPTTALTFDLGARWDRHSLVRASQVSPRFNLAWAVGERSVVRAAWGRFTQSQRPYELQVEDGEAAFAAVERSEHRVIGFETLLSGAASAPRLALRVEAYQREVLNPRARFENLYEPLNVFPEVEPDRVRTAPERSLAQGVEIFARGRFTPRLTWWANYTLASTEDRIGGLWAPRLYDETHSVTLDLDYELSLSWRLNVAWRYHTGWPTTPLAVAPEVDEEGETVYVPVLGEINSDRLSSYHRLDLRASRRWQRRRFAFDLYLDLQNLYNRKNLAGFDFEIDEEVGSIVATPEDWAGLLPSAGIRLEF